jgi:SAM-dependent methyltransferase
MWDVTSFSEWFGDDPERERRGLDASTAYFDASSQRWLSELGVPRGGQCLDLGAGTGTMTRWLAEQVGPGGCVVAADLDVRHLRDMPPHVDIRTLDARVDDLGESCYDVIFARFLLVLVPNWSDVLARMASALRPGGLLVVQELDGAANEWPAGAQLFWPPSGDALMHQARQEMVALARQFGVDPGLAWKLAFCLLDLGLDDVGCRGVRDLIRAGSPHARAERSNLRDGLAGLVTFGRLDATEAVDQLDRLAPEQGAAWLGLPSVVTWGRRPVSIGRAAAL